MSILSVPSEDKKQAAAALAQEYKFSSKLEGSGLDLLPRRIEILQINITKLCNQACVHCHVDASPRRREMMSDAVVEEVFRLLDENPGLKNLDITGGAPELHPRFEEMVRRARAMNRLVMVRHNLTVTLDPHPLTQASLRHLPDFFREQRVEVISSLPYHHEFLTDKQRGSGVFKKSIASLQLLNAVGYGQPGSGLVLNLVYNPVGSYLPAPEADLERDYKRELASAYGISFNKLFALTNMPIHRFKAQLRKNKTYEDYMEKLVAAFNPGAAAGIMCRSLISLSHDGRVYDCDFNQMLDLPVEGDPGLAALDLEVLEKRRIVTADHCFGCTAGAGSSCGGSTT